MTKLTITVDKAPNLRRAQARAEEIADKFYGVTPGDRRGYQLEQTNAYPEQQVVTTVAGAQVAASPVTFYVEFAARQMS